MFQFKEKLKRLDVPAKNVLRLQRSLGDVQIVLPGIKSQRATAYVCAFSVEQGLRVAIAFHLRETNSIVFYLNDGGYVSRKEIGAILHEGVVFAETLGFMLTDLDIHQADPDERKALWESLPLKNPPKPEPVNKPVPVAEPSPAAAGGGASVAPSGPAAGAKSVPGAPAKTAVPVAPAAPAAAANNEEIDLGLPRSGSLATMRRKKAPPTAEELEEKRTRLRESLGRFLSSM